MDPISGHAKSLRDLLMNKKYSIHYYQREYRWGSKQIKELLDDLTEEFFDNYVKDDSRKEVSNYGCYFMGSVIITGSAGDNAIIDGQQRLTSLTLLLIHLNNLQKKYGNPTTISNLIYSEAYGEKSFNINADERNECLDALFNEKPYDDPHKSESVTNILRRYQDISDNFSDNLSDEGVLFHFIDWLMDRVFFIEIVVATEQDAHKVFVTMNDRGLSLSPTEMLKGYLLSEISDDCDRNKAEKLWKDRIRELKNKIDDEKEPDDEFIKTWLRSQYAITIRDTKKGAIPRDFDLIGTEFHKWVHENASDKIKIRKSTDYCNLIENDFNKYSEIYLRLKDYSRNFNPSFPYVYFNANRNFTLQYQVIIAAIKTTDSETDIDRKINIVSAFIDQYSMRRAINYKSVDYSSIKNSMFSVTKNIRRLDTDELKKHLIKELDQMEFTIEGVDSLYLNGYTKRFMVHFLARISYFLEVSCDDPDVGFVKYVNRGSSNSFDIEHIMADDFESYKDLFRDENEFNTYRSRVGNLILLPIDKNRSIQNSNYDKKLIVYAGENILAKTLCSGFYVNNPRFTRYSERSRINFHPISTMDRESVECRQNLYKQIAHQVWNSNIIKDM